MQTSGLVVEFLRYIRRRYSKHTHIGYERTLRRLLDGTPQNYEDITLEHIEGFLQSLSLGVNSLNTTITALKSFGRWCEEYHDLPNIAAKVKYAKSAPFKQRIITPAELDKILAVCNDGERAMILFLANTGLRTAELKALTTESVSPDGRLLYITGKGGKRRAVPLNQVAKANLSNAINFSKSCRLWKTCQKLSMRAGIKPFSPHSLRHFFATQMSKSVPLCLLSKLLGHSSTAITEKIYVHLGDADLIGLTDMLGKDPPEC